MAARAALLGLTAALAGLGQLGHVTPPTRPAPLPVQAAGLHNVFRLSGRLLSGSSPEGDAGFASLRALGVRTVVTVDGAAPDVAAAGRYGLRYVHLPVGYDGVPADQADRIARAVRDLPGPVYVHCHHGKHRGPAAVACAVLALDPAATPADAAGWLRAAGTDPRYGGLVGVPRSYRPPTRAALDRVPGDFPAVVAVPDLPRLMVAVDERWDRLKDVKAAGWRSPPGHPDVHPPHEAVQLRELYREAARLPEASRRGGEFRALLAEAEAAAGELEVALRAKPAAAKGAFERSQAACNRCHAGHRDR